MNIVGKSIVLRAIEEEDLPFLLELINDPQIEATTLGGCHPVSMMDQQNWYRNCDFQKELRCIIENKAVRHPIGYLSLTDIDWVNRCGSVSCKMRSGAQDRFKGDLEEALQLGIRYCFENQNLRRLEAMILKNNCFSLRIAKKVGFKEEGILRERCYKHGTWLDVVMLALLKS